MLQQRGLFLLADREADQGVRPLPQRLLKNNRNIIIRHRGLLHRLSEEGRQRGGVSRRTGQQTPAVLRCDEQQDGTSVGVRQGRAVTVK